MAAKPEIEALFKAAAEEAGAEARGPSLAAPRLAIDDGGRVHLVVRALEPVARVKYWQPYVTTMTEQGWSAPALVPFSAGRLSMQAAAAPRRKAGCGWPGRATTGPPSRSSSRFRKRRSRRTSTPVVSSPTANRDPDRRAGRAAVPAARSRSRRRARRRRAPSRLARASADKSCGSCAVTPTATPSSRSTGAAAPTDRSSTSIATRSTPPRSTSGSSPITSTAPSASTGGGSRRSWPTCSTRRNATSRCSATSAR